VGVDCIGVDSYRPDDAAGWDVSARRMV